MALADMDLSRTRPIILVANKIDLARSKVVSSQGEHVQPSQIITKILLIFLKILIDGRCLACTHRTKFIEVSVGINHNVDELLAGTLTQIRLKKEQNELQVSTKKILTYHEEKHKISVMTPSLQASKDPSGHWYKNRNVVRASMKARQMVSWIFGKEDSKFRNCENLQVL